jgi:hypothetical protein
VRDIVIGKVAKLQLSERLVEYRLNPITVLVVGKLVLALKLFLMELGYFSYDAAALCLRRFAHVVGSVRLDVEMIDLVGLLLVRV